MINLSYNDKLLIANKYLYKFGIDWEDLPDINSLHDCDSAEEIYEMCDDRLRESGWNDTDNGFIYE